MQQIDLDLGTEDGVEAFVEIESADKQRAIVEKFVSATASNVILRTFVQELRNHEEEQWVWQTYALEKIAKNDPSNDDLAFVVEMARSEDLIDGDGFVELATSQLLERSPDVDQLLQVIQLPGFEIEAWEMLERQVADSTLDRPLTTNDWRYIKTCPNEDVRRRAALLEI